MKTDDRDPVIVRMVEGLGPPRPPSDLRPRVLSAARQRIEAEIPDLWSRIWDHRGIRLAWAAGFTILVAGHLAASRRNMISGLQEHTRMVAENNINDIVDILRPAQISEHVQPIVGIFATSDEPIDLDLGGDPS